MTHLIPDARQTRPGRATRWGVVLTLGLLVLLVTLAWRGGAARGIPWSDARPGVLAAAVAVYGLVHLARAWRFSLVLGRRSPGTIRLLPVSAAVSLLNHVWVARAGDLAFAGLVRRAGSVTLARGVAAVAMARLLDLLAIGLLVLPTAALAGSALPDRAVWIAVAAGLAAAVVIALFSAVPVTRRLAGWLDRWAMGRAGRLGRWGVRGADGLDEIGETWREVREDRQRRFALLASMLAWGLTFLWLHMLLSGLGWRVPLAPFVLGAVVGTLAKALPLPTVGGHGLAEAGWTLGFVAVLGWEPMEAAAAGLAVGALTVLIAAPYGLLGLVWLGARPPGDAGPRHRSDDARPPIRAGVAVIVAMGGSIALGACTDPPRSQEEVHTGWQAFLAERTLPGDAVVIVSDDATPSRPPGAWADDLRWEFLTAEDPPGPAIWPSVDALGPHARLWSILIDAESPGTSPPSTAPSPRLVRWLDARMWRVGAATVADGRIVSWAPVPELPEGAPAVQGVAPVPLGPLELLAWDATQRPHAGGPLRVRISWLVTRPSAPDVDVELQLLDAAGEGWTATSDRDGPPASGDPSAARFTPMEITVAPYDLQVRADAPPGLYRLAVAVEHEAGGDPDEVVHELGTIRVVGRSLEPTNVVR